MWFVYFTISTFHLRAFLCTCLSLPQPQLREHLSGFSGSALAFQTHLPPRNRLKLETRGGTDSPVLRRAGRWAAVSLLALFPITGGPEFPPAGRLSGGPKERRSPARCFLGPQDGPRFFWELQTVWTGLAHSKRCSVSWLRGGAALPLFLLPCLIWSLPSCLPPSLVSWR